MEPKIKTTVVGSYPVPDWLAALPSEQALIDATSVVFKIQENAGIDLVADGELYRFDINHPDTNGMIDYFVRPLSGVRSDLTLSELRMFRADEQMAFRSKPAGLVVGEIKEGGLNLPEDYRRARALTLSRRNARFTARSWYSSTARTGSTSNARSDTNSMEGALPASSEREGTSSAARGGRTPRVPLSASVSRASTTARRNGPRRSGRARSRRASSPCAPSGGVTYHGRVA